MNRYLEVYKLAEEAVLKLVSLEGFKENFPRIYVGDENALTFSPVKGSRLGTNLEIDRFYLDLSTMIFQDLIICLQSFYYDEKISLNILFQELIKINDLMIMENISGDLIWKEITKFIDPLIFSKYAGSKFSTEYSRNLSFLFIFTSLEMNKSAGIILEDKFFQSKLVTVFDY